MQEYTENGYYKDKKENIIALCWKNKDEIPVRLMSGLHGPMGEVSPGDWCCDDGSGFKLSIKNEEFQQRFEFICETCTGRIKQVYIDTGVKDET